MSAKATNNDLLNESLLSSLYFTKSVGARVLKKDVTFCDAIGVGGYPAEEKILKLVRIIVYMSDRTDKAVIVGLRVTYKMRGKPETVTVLHGIETQYIAGELIVKDDQLLVGATGRLKNLTTDLARNRRLAFIEFALFNRDNGHTELQGPFGSKDHLGVAWGSYGPILALEGTVWQVLPPPTGVHPGAAEEDPEELARGQTGAGLTTLGFTRLVQGVPEFGILGC